MVLYRPVSNLVELSTGSFDVSLWKRLSFVAASEEANARVCLAHQRLPQEINAVLCSSVRISEFTI